jgi:hypothetical protein
MEYQQHRRWVEAQRRFEEKYERRRRFLESRLKRPEGHAEVSTIYDDVPFGGSAEPEAPIAPSRQPFRFQFSMWQLLAAMTGAAVILGFVNFLGGPDKAATLLGFLALGGLLAHAMGAEPPDIVVFAWWLILVMYVFLSLGAVVAGSFS